MTHSQHVVSDSGSSTRAAVLTTRQGHYSLLEVELPGQELQPAGVLLFDPVEDRLEFRLRRDWEYIAEPEDAEVLSLLEDDLSAKTREMGPEALLRYLEDTLSNVVRVAERETVLLGNFETTLNRLYNRLVPATELPYETHLPVFSCEAAAGKFLDDIHVEEQGWVEAPPDVHPSEKMFVAKVVGRSMEPLIPDGSRCIFQADVAGSRTGRKLLVENHAESEAGGQRYTVKRYRSEKIAHEDGAWEHARIFMEPLNPEFDTWEIKEGDQCRVVAEFLRVLD